MSCPVCNAPDYINCNCEVSEPFCDPCSSDSKCVQKIDAECVIYHRDDDKATKLTCLGLPNKTSAEAIFEKIDTFICQINDTQIPITPIDTDSIDLTAFGELKHTLQADVNISAASGNTLEILSDGLYASSASGHTYTADQGIELKPTDHNFRLVEVLDGAATKFLWNYTKAAFRAGEATATQWNNSNIGAHSVAFGLDTFATAVASFSGGETIVNNGAHSFVYGQSNTIQSTYTSAFGLNVTTTSVATGSFLGGTSIASTQPYAAVFGRSNSVAGVTALGIAQGGSFVAGLGNAVRGEGNVALGETNLVTGDFSMAIGLENSNIGDHTYMYGRHLQDIGTGNVVITGVYDDNADLANDTIAVAPINAQPAFVVGNGYVTGVFPTEVNNLFNGLIVYKSGTVRIYGALDQRSSTRGIIPARWTNGGRPPSPQRGEQGYNTTADKMEYWNGTSWIQF